MPKFFFVIIIKKFPYNPQTTIENDVFPTKKYFSPREQCRERERGREKGMFFWSYALI